MRSSRPEELGWQALFRPYAVAAGERVPTSEASKGVLWILRSAGKRFGRLRGALPNPNPERYSMLFWFNRVGARPAAS